MRCCAVLLSMVLAGPALLADSDGYYCAGKGYLAYERAFSWSERGHWLQVVRFSREKGIVEAQPLRLEEFQTHWMKCGPAAVELAGWDTRYVVDVSGWQGPRLREKTKLEKPGAMPQGFAQTNLGNWSKAGVTDLIAAEGASRFELVVTKTERVRPGAVEHYTVTEIVQRGEIQGSPIQASLRLFSGIFVETID